MAIRNKLKRGVRAPRAAAAVEGKDLARKLWLAGLGAVSLAQKNSQQLVTTLVEEGEDFKIRAEKFAKTALRDARKTAADVQKQVKGAIAPIKTRATRAARKFENQFGDRIGAVLGRLGVPSKGDVQELLGRVTELNRQVKTKSTRRRAA